MYLYKKYENVTEFAGYTADSMLRIIYDKAKALSGSLAEKFHSVAYKIIKHIYRRNTQKVWKIHLRLLWSVSTARENPQQSCWTLCINGHETGWKGVLFAVVNIINRMQRYIQAHQEMLGIQQGGRLDPTYTEIRICWNYEQVFYWRNLVQIHDRIYQCFNFGLGYKRHSLFPRWLCLTEYMNTVDVGTQPLRITNAN